MAAMIKLCSFVVVLGLITLPFGGAETKVLQQQQQQPSYQQHDYQPAIDQKPAASERLFDLSSWVNRYPTYYYNRPYYPGGSYLPSSRYPTTGGGYYPSSGYYPNYNYNGYYPNTQYGGSGYGGGVGYQGGGGYGGYGGFGGGLNGYVY